ncbi:MAG: DUF1294 domain-containing protein [Planctomycetota bacterium]|jgi:uncharacterized membrane protein YsdA (DUF1294 family)
MTRHSPKLLFLTLAAVVITVLSLLQVHFLNLRFLYAYFTSINLTLFIFYGFDKFSSIKGRLRTPELVLHLLALAGGSIGALFAQIIFRHKTRKRSFKIIFMVIVLIQLIAAAALYLYAHSA